MPQDFQFRTQFLQQAEIDRLHLFAGGTALQHFGKDLGQRDEMLKVFGSGRFGACGPIGQIQDPVQHPQGQGLAAYRTAALEFFRVGRFQALFTFAMPIQVVFAFIRKEFQGAEEACLSFSRRRPRPDMRGRYPGDLLPGRFSGANGRRNWRLKHNGPDCASASSWGDRRTDRSPGHGCGLPDPHNIPLSYRSRFWSLTRKTRESRYGPG